MSDDRTWWKDGVFYQVYPRSWADSNSDGIGDIPGIMAHLDHLEWLGVEGLWLNPLTKSPNDDWGYDVSDYCDINPEYGDLAKIDELIGAAGERGIRVILDLVPNHTSIEHPWFVDARSSRSARHRDCYVWADPKPDGSPPNNWLSVFTGESAWELDEGTGQYYLHNFLVSMPDLDWWNDDVKDAFDEILEFWFARGAAGFRIDVAHAIVKDRQLRDNLPVTEDDHPEVKRLGQRLTHSMNRPEVHDVLRRWRKVADRQDPARILIGETYIFDLEDWATYYGSDDELHLAFNFPFIFSEFDAESLRAVVDAAEKLLRPEAWPVWTGSNHDVGRFPTRWCGGDEAKVRCALMLLLTLRGTPFLYYGDEIGMPETPLGYDDLKDPAGKVNWPTNPGRDPGRTPMHWSAEPGAGFTTADATPWLPLGDHDACNVADQRDDPASVLNLTRDLIALRRGSPDLTRGNYEALPSPERAWAFRRGEATVVGINLSDAASTIHDVTGEIALSTTRGRDGERVEDRFRLEAWEGVVVRVSG